MPRTLVIFDMDGTLIHSTGTDNAAIADTYRDLFGCEIDTDWSHYRTSTDTGIAREILERLGRPGDAETIAAIEDGIARRLEASTDAITLIAGAVPLLATCRGLPGFAVAVASGSFARTARVKSGKAGLILDHLPRAFSDTHDERTGVIGVATARAAQAAYVDGFERRVYVGDGLWDVAAARALGIGFVGIGTGDAAERLLAAGAPAVLDDHADLEATLRAIGSAQVPA